MAHSTNQSGSKSMRTRIGHMAIAFKSFQHQTGPTILFLTPDLSLLDVYDEIIKRFINRGVERVVIAGFRRVDVWPDKGKKEFLSSVRRLYPQAECYWLRTDLIGRAFTREIIGTSSFIFYTAGSGAYPKALKIEEVSLRKVTGYLQYGYLLGDHPDFQFSSPHITSSHYVFAHNRRELNLYTESIKKAKSNSRVILTGYPRWERSNLRETGEDSQKQLILVAPHWTIATSTTTGPGDFLSYRHSLKKIALENPNLAFGWLPHPNFLSEIRKLTLGVQRSARRDLNLFLSLPNVSDFSGKSITELVTSSTAMITDSVSFLADYYPTGKPLYPLHRNGRKALNPLGERLIESYKSRWGLTSLETFVARVGDGGARASRTEELHLLSELDYNLSKSASKQILNAVLESIYPWPTN